MGINNKNNLKYTDENAFETKQILRNVTGWLSCALVLASSSLAPPSMTEERVYRRVGGSMDSRIPCLARPDTLPGPCTLRANGTSGAAASLSGPTEESDGACNDE